MNEYTVIGVVVAAFIAAGVLSYFFTPPVKRFAHKVGAIDVPKDNRRMHKEPIPRLGGLAIFGGFLCSILVFGQLDQTMLCVLLGVVVLLGVLLLALLCMRAGVELVGVSGEVTLDAIYGPLRIPLWPRPRHLKRKEKKKQAEPEKKPEEAPPKGKFSLAKSGLPFGKIADVALDFLGDLTGSLQITRLRVRLIIATGDAAKTGILFGQTAALCGILVPFLENTFDLRDIHVRADPDFEKDKTEWAAEVFCAIRPIAFIRIAFRHRKPLRRLYELLKQGVKA